MAGFCGSCGAPVLGAFCTQCGTKSAGPAAPAQSTAIPAQPTPVQPVPVTTAPQSVPMPQQPTSAMPQMAAPITPQPAKGSAWGKILLAFFVIFLVVAVGAIGVTVYGYYWAKHKITSFASAVTNGTSSEMKVVSSGDSCKLLSAADVQQALGVPIQKSAEIEEGSDPGCAYFTDDVSLAKLQKMATEQARKQATEASKKGQPQDNPLAMLKETDQIQGLVKNFGLSGADSNGKVFSFTIQKNFGDDSWSGMRLVESAVPGFHDVTGIGDHAMIGSFGHAFYFVKGETMVHMDTSLVPDVRTRGAVIAKKILGKL